MKPEDRAKFKIIPGEGYVGVAVLRVPAAANYFIANQWFVEFLHELLAAAAPSFDDLQAFAARGAGHDDYNLSIFDGRIEPWHALNPSQIPDLAENIGIFHIGSGHISADQYRRNAAYKCVSRHGFAVVPSRFYAAALKSLLTLEQTWTQRALAATASGKPN